MGQSKRIIVDGMSFIQSGRPYYYNSNTRKYLHRYLWEKAYGEIPEGYEVHHKDHNPFNNELSNLELKESREHKLYHSRTLTDEHRAFLRENMDKKARPAAIKWHKSKEGREWHKKHYENTKSKLHKEITRTCDMCGVKYETEDTGKNRFCSNKCKAKWRRKSGVDNEVRVCEWCGNGFSVNKYSKSTHCSRSCRSKNIHYKRKSKDSPNLQE